MTRIRKEGIGFLDTSNLVPLCTYHQILSPQTESIIIEGSKLYLAVVVLVAKYLLVYSNTNDVTITN